MIRIGVVGLLLATVSQCCSGAIVRSKPSEEKLVGKPVEKNEIPKHLRSPLHVKVPEAPKVSLPKPPNGHPGTAKKAKAEEAAPVHTVLARRSKPSTEKLVGKPVEKNEIPKHLRSPLHVKVPEAPKVSLPKPPNGHPGTAKNAKIVEAAPVHTVLAKGSSQANSTAATNSTVESNTTQAACLSRVYTCTPAIGKVFALYYSTMSGEKVTQIEARDYKVLSAPPPDSVVFHPTQAISLKRGDNCPFRLKSHTTVMSDWRKWNLRLAEVAICERSVWGNPCGPNAKGCEIEMFAPLPYNSDEEQYIGAGMALTAQSFLCAQRKEAWQQSACAITRNKAAIGAGLTKTAGGIKLKPIPGVWTDLKMDATSGLRFSEAVFAAANEPDYKSSKHYESLSDPLAHSRTPPQASFCDNLSCLVAKFMPNA
jgi:hypothetical protein